MDDSGFTATIHDGSGKEIGETSTYMQEDGYALSVCTLYRIFNFVSICLSPFCSLHHNVADGILNPVIGMEGAMATMSHSNFKCPIGKGSVETMSHYFL